MSWFSKLFKKKKKTKILSSPVTSNYVTKEQVDKFKLRVWDIPPKTLEDEIEDIKEESDKARGILEKAGVFDLKVDFTKMAIKNIKPLDLMKVNFKASPNKSNRKSGEPPKYIVLHHTGPGSFNGIVNWLCNKDAKAAAHYVLGTNAQLTQLVSNEHMGWHAGRARWGDTLRNNSHSIGIEICNLGVLDYWNARFHYEQGRVPKEYKGKVEPVMGTIVYPSGHALSGYYVPYPEKQINKLVALCKALVKKYPEITRDNILTHFEIAQPESRKQDPFGLDIERIKNMIFEG